MSRVKYNLGIDTFKYTILFSVCCHITIYQKRRPNFRIFLYDNILYVKTFVECTSLFRIYFVKNNCYL